MNISNRIILITVNNNYNNNNYKYIGLAQTNYIEI